MEPPTTLCRRPGGDNQKIKSFKFYMPRYKIEICIFNFDAAEINIAQG